MVTLTPTPDTVNWLTATMMSALMVAGDGDECADGCGGDECVDGCQQWQ